MRSFSFSVFTLLLIGTLGTTPGCARAPRTAEERPRTAAERLRAEREEHARLMAHEMGKPILYCPGLDEMDRQQRSAMLVEPEAHLADALLRGRR